MHAMHTNRRASARDQLALPIALANGSAAMTRNISAEGLFLTLPSGQAIADWLLLECDVPSAGVRFKAAGEVVRIERGVAEDGVALRLHAPQLLPLGRPGRRRPTGASEVQPLLLA
ncbi:MAG: hypothetical protein NVS2B4_01920 [Ramlibacter sp.]